MLRAGADEGREVQMQVPNLLALLVQTYKNRRHRSRRSSFYFLFFFANIDDTDRDAPLFEMHAILLLILLVLLVQKYKYWRS